MCDSYYLAIEKLCILSVKKIAIKMKQVLHRFTSNSSFLNVCLL